jgi:hypothetical protein
MSNYSYIYESAQIENFERQILSGYLTQTKLKTLIESNQLSEQQLAVVEELFPSLRNLKTAAKGAMTGLKGAYQKGKEFVQKNRPQSNPQSQDQPQDQPQSIEQSQATKWKEIDNTINNSLLLQKMETFRTLFPQDRFVNDATAYFNKVLLELQEYLARYYPHMDIESTGQPFESELEKQAQQKRIDAQVDAGGERMNRREAGLPVGNIRQNPRKSRVQQPLNVRQRTMTGDSWNRKGKVQY